MHGALAVTTELRIAFRFLAATPGAGHRREDLTAEPVRFWPVFAYLIVYDASAQPLGIVRILHGYRDLELLLRGRSHLA
jgi:plasmid stabilization system protein ParE